jgi:hypothetical protein
MESTQAITLVSDWIRSRGLDYPTEGLEADRFEAGWSVYAPVEVDESDPMSFLDMPVGRSVFLIGDSGRIEEVSSSVPPLQAQAEFSARELAAKPATNGSDEAEFMAEFERQFREAASNDPEAIADFTILDAPSDAGEATADDQASAEEASRLIEPIVQQLAQLGPTGWEEFSAEFAFTVTAQVAQLRFWSVDRTGLVPVPQSVADLVRSQREVAARMPAGPWWRLLLNVTNSGETTIDYDYGDEPFPDDQLLAPEHYRSDLEAYPRDHIPVWLAGYVAGPEAQSRQPHQAAADAANGEHATPTGDLSPLRDLWSRRPTPASDRSGGHVCTPATPGMRATAAADQHFSCCRGTAPCSPEGSGTPNFWRVRTTATNRCPTSTREPPPGSRTACSTRESATAC